MDMQTCLFTINKTGHSQVHLVSRTSCYRKEIRSKVSFTCVYSFIFGNELTPLLVVESTSLRNFTRTGSFG